MSELNWIKSSYSWNWQELKCIEIAALPDGQVAFRNSRDPDGPRVAYTRDELAAFLAGAKNGEFDHLVA